jgi:hypothetical protein
LDYTSVIINIGILIPIMMDISKNNAFKHSRGRNGQKLKGCRETDLLVSHANILVMMCTFLSSKVKSRKSAFKAR